MGFFVDQTGQVTSAVSHPRCHRAPLLYHANALLRCDCDESDIELALNWEESDFWGPPGPHLEISGRRTVPGWRGRLREAWVVLRRGFPWTDMMILDRDSVAALHEWLGAQLEDDPT